jgi:hypothetical protein
MQCKRPQGLDAVTSRLRDARRQIVNALEHVAAGIIALDCSAFIRPSGMLIEQLTADEAMEFYSKRTEKLILDKILREMRPEILGAYVFARAPAMIALRKSTVVSSFGRPFIEARPESICPSLVVSNPNSVIPACLRYIYSRLMNASASE